MCNSCQSFKLHWPLSPKPFNFGYRCFGVFRYSLTPSRSLVRSSCYTLYMFTAIRLPPGGSSTVHIYTQTTHRTTQSKQHIEQHKIEECGPCPVFAGFALAFALQMRKKRLTTVWKVRRSNPGVSRFSARPDRPWGPSSLLYNGYWVFPEGKVRPGSAAYHSPPSSAAVMED